MRKKRWPRFAALFGILCALCCFAACEEEPPAEEKAEPGIYLTALEQTYTGEALYPVVTAEPAGVSDIKLHFYAGEEEVASMVAAGTYRVVAVAENGAVDNAEAEFVIRRAVIDLAAVSLPAKQYDGTTDYRATVAKLPGAGGNAVSLEIEGRLSAAEGENVRLAVTKIALVGEEAENFELGSAEALYVDIIA